MTTLPGTLVIQPRPGIGDMIWHLPHIRAIAREVEGGPVCLLTKSNAQAKTWLYNEPSIAHIDYLDRRQMWRKGWSLRRHRFHSAWVLHESFSYALVSLIAGIPERIGPGFGAQGTILTNQSLPDTARQLRHIEQMNLLLAGQGLTVKTEDQRLLVDPVVQEKLIPMYYQEPRPWIAFGVGASDAGKKWPLEYFIKLATLLKGTHSTEQKGTFFICGSKHEKADILWVCEEMTRLELHAVPVFSLSLPEVFSLLSKMDLFVGNDSGLLNASACLGVTSIGLFGATALLKYSPYMHTIACPDSVPWGIEGMKAILPEEVFEKARALIAQNTGKES